MNCLLKSGYHEWILYCVFALAFSVVSQILGLFPIVPQKMHTVRYLGCGTFLETSE